MKTFFLTLTSIFFFLIILYFHFQDKLYQPFVSEEKIIYFTSGTRTLEILSTLEDNKIVPSKWVLILDLILHPKHLSLKHGEYKFQKGMSPFDIMEKIYKGDTLSYKITIPEGLTSFEIVERLKKIEELEGTLTHIPTEGSLFPSTYEYKRGQTRGSLLDRMQKEMEKILNDLSKEYSSKDIKEKLIMASLIEKETSVDHERPRIAGVFYNRLRKKMKLQCDPTVIYAVTHGKQFLSRPLSKTDLMIDSPFNTYRIYGLPPAPICNPGKESIIAALNPLTTNELFFVVKEEGREHEFNDSLENHNIAVQKLRKRERK